MRFISDSIPIIYLSCLIIISTCSGQPLFPLNNNNNYNENDNERVDSLSQPVEEKLIKLYGQDTYNRHKDQFLQIANLPQAHQEPEKHIAQPIPLDTDYLHNELDKVRLEALTQTRSHEQQLELPELRKFSQPVISRLVRNLLIRLEMLEKNPLVEPTSALTDRCSMQGLWVSAVKGVAIHLEPNGLNSLKLEVLSMPHSQKVEHPFVSNGWTGTAQLSSLVPTTIAIILQERVTDREIDLGRKSPKTAVFSGQCMICNGMTAIQGVWTIYPEQPVCFKDVPKYSGDMLYLV